MGVHHALDFLLTFQVNCARGRSDKAVGLLEQDRRAGRAGAGAQRSSLDAISFADGDHTLSRQMKLGHAILLLKVFMS
jgi:hypothetical protein